MAEQTSIGANDGVIVTPVGATPSTGPFAVDFPFDNLDDVIVISTDSAGAASVLVRGVDYTLAATVNGDGLYPSGTVTLLVARANVTLARVRHTPLERTSQLPLTGYLDRAALNSDLNRMMMAMQDFDRRYGQFIRMPTGDPVVDAVVPDKATRVGKAFVWDANGFPAAGVLVATNVILNDFWKLTVLPTIDAATARSALGAAGLTTTNSFTGANSFGGTTSFTGVASFSLSPTAPAPPTAADDSTKVPNTAWVQDAIDARLAASVAVPVIVELLTGTALTWIVPAGTKWFDVEMVGGGGGGGANSPGNAGAATTFDGVSVAGGSGGAAFFGRSGVYGNTGGPGGTGGSGGTGTGTATTIIRRAGSHGSNGTTAGVSAVGGDTLPSNWAAVGGSGAPSQLGGAPGKGGLSGPGNAGAANSGAGGGGWGDVDGNSGAGGGGSGEYALLRYATPAASYTYSVGAGAAGGGNLSSGGSGYIRIRCHFNF